MTTADSVEILRILVVDDEAGMRTGVTRSLQNMNVHVPEVDRRITFELAVAADGSEALRMLDSFEPDLLLLDYKLPDISGLEILARLEAAPRDLLTIMLTAYATLETAVTATRRGAFDFLAKPYNPGELRAVVEKASRHLVLRRHAEALASERRRIRFEFTRVLAHELKAPIAVVEGYLYLLQAGTLPPDSVGSVVERSITRLEGMRKLIADLLDMTRLESGEKKRELKRVDLVEVATRAVEGFEHQAAPRGITVTLHPCPPVPMVADEGELEMVLNNLVSNAIKYNVDGGRVEVEINATVETATIRVTDTGIGMTQEEQDRLFREFSRIKNKKTADILGSGLGLSILRRIAGLYDGQVAVESTPDVGSTFTVELTRASRPLETAT